MMEFNEQVKSAIPDITLQTARALLADLATSNDFLKLTVQHRIHLAAIELLIIKLQREAANAAA
jgi:hypothetical protein